MTVRTSPPGGPCNCGFTQPTQHSAPNLPAQPTRDLACCPENPCAPPRKWVFVPAKCAIVNRTGLSPFPLCLSCLDHGFVPRTRAPIVRLPSAIRVRCSPLGRQATLTLFTTTGRTSKSRKSAMGSIRCCASMTFSAVLEASARATSGVLRAIRQARRRTASDAIRR